MQPPAYDAEMILNALRRVVRVRARWSLFFARTGIEPLRIFYEDVAADPQFEVSRVAAFMRCTEPSIIAREMVTVERQSDPELQAWRTRFLAERGNRDMIDGF